MQKPQLAPRAPKPLSRADLAPAKRLAGLRDLEPEKWRKLLEKAFEGGATIDEARERLGGVTRDCLLRHVGDLEARTGARLDRPTSGRKGERPGPGTGRVFR
jgi:hypothetical protein